MGVQHWWKNTSKNPAVLLSAGEEKIAAITESSVRFPCPPRTVVGVLLIAAIPRSPPLIRTEVYRGSAAVSHWPVRVGSVSLCRGAAAVMVRDAKQSG